MKRGSKKNSKNSLDIKEYKDELIEDEKVSSKEENIIEKDEERMITPEEKVILHNVEKIIEKEEKVVGQKEKNFIYNLQRLKYRHQILFSIIIVVAVVLVWRGMWNLVDEYWFPSISDFSNISSVIVGILVLIITNKAINQLAGGLS